MKTVLSTMMVLSLLGAAFTFTACGSSAAKEDTAANTSLELGPDWFENRAGEQPNRIYAYGQSAGERNVALARESAKAAAQDEMAQFLQVKIESLLERYLSSISGGEGAEEQRLTENALRRITQQSINGFQIEKTGAKGQYYYARGYIAFDDLSKAMRASDELNEKVKEVRENAEAFFNKLDEAIAKENWKSGE